MDPSMMMQFPQTMMIPTPIMAQRLGAGVQPALASGVASQKENHRTASDKRRKTSDKVTTIFVGGLRKTTDADKVAAHFAKFGEINTVDIKRLPDGTSRGFAFVEFTTVEAVEKVVEARSSHMIDNKWIAVRPHGGDDFGGPDRRSKRTSGERDEDEHEQLDIPAPPALPAQASVVATAPAPQTNDASSIGVFPGSGAVAAGAPVGMVAMQPMMGMMPCPGMMMCPPGMMAMQSGMMGMQPAVMGMPNNTTPGMQPAMMGMMPAPGMMAMTPQGMLGVPTPGVMLPAPDMMAGAVAPNAVMMTGTGLPATPSAMGIPTAGMMSLPAGGTTTCAPTVAAGLLASSREGSNSGPVQDLTVPCRSAPY